MAPIERRNGELVYYKDRVTVMILLMCELPLIHYYHEQVANGGFIVWFGFHAMEAEPLVAKLDSNTPMPIPDVKAFIVADTLYKTILYERRGS